MFDFLASVPRSSVLVVAGPTGSGKSSFALEGALRDRGEIINGDSLQLYTGLPILTACPTSVHKYRVPHHLYETLDGCHQTFSAADWCREVEVLIKDILSRNKRPWIVGGTGFYLKALTEGLSPIPSLTLEEKKAWYHHRNISYPLRAGTIAPLDLQAMKDELAFKDPVTASRIGDVQRIVHALMVYDLTQSPLSFWQNHPPVRSPFTFFTILIWPCLADVWHQVDQRFTGMLSRNVYEEVSLFSGKAKPSNPLWHAIGIQSIHKWIQGTMSEKQAKDSYIQETRQYIKRQRTWFRHQFCPQLIVPHSYQSL